MNGKTAKALRKAFKAKENPIEFKAFKRALRGSDPIAREKALVLARYIAFSGKEVHRGTLHD